MCGVRMTNNSSASPEHTCPNPPTPNGGLFSNIPKFRQNQKIKLNAWWKHLNAPTKHNYCEHAISTTPEQLKTQHDKQKNYIKISILNYSITWYVHLGWLLHLADAGHCDHCIPIFQLLTIFFPWPLCNFQTTHFNRTNEQTLRVTCIRQSVFGNVNLSLIWCSFDM